MYCTNCGTLLAADARFCSTCGMEQKSAGQERWSAPVPPPVAPIPEPNREKTFRRSAGRFLFGDRSKGPERNWGGMITLMIFLAAWGVGVGIEAATDGLDTYVSAQDRAECADEDPNRQSGCIRGGQAFQVVADAFPWLLLMTGVAIAGRYIRNRRH